MKSFLDHKEFSINSVELDELIKKYIFIYASDQSNIIENQIIYQNVLKSNVVLIDQYEEKNSNFNTYIIIGFHNTIIVIEKTSFSMLKRIFATNKSLIFYFLTEINDLNIDITYQIKKKQDFQINDEIKSFNSYILNHISCKKEIRKMWEIIIPCISGYLVIESYEKSKINRIKNINNVPPPSSNIEIINEDEFITLKILGTGAIFIVELIYHIKKNELLALKRPNINDMETPKLIQREINNHLKINHPLLPKLIGTNKNKEYIIIEFINGITLKERIKENQLNYYEKITIIFELMIIIDYLHRNEFIYRDLKPDNIMIDYNKTAVLIDFDRMIKFDDVSDVETRNFTYYAAPEVNKLKFSEKCDIYSLGLIIRYLTHSEMAYNANLMIQEIIQMCVNESPNARPSIKELILEFFIIYQSLIDIEKEFRIYINQEYFKIHEFFENKIKEANQNDQNAQCCLGLIFSHNIIVPRDINKTIHYYTLAADQNNQYAQCKLGLIYYEQSTININKAIHYFTLASNQNNSESQYFLGLIYYEKKFNMFDIDKSIYFLTLSSNNNNIHALYALGSIYSNGKYVPRDIKKAIYFYTKAADLNYHNAQYRLGYLYSTDINNSYDIYKALHYLTLAADQNHPEAQNKLGNIYSKDNKIPHDINKAFHYYTLAANQNFKFAQKNLGDIYYNDIFIPRDIQKAIYYYTLAADQNVGIAQRKLGDIYYNDEFVPRDIYKAIHYYTLAANKNVIIAQRKLGDIYYNDEFVPRDIYKVIHYYTLAANKNVIIAQRNLGDIYYNDEFVPRNIQKAIHYFTLAANQNDAESQFNLGCIYYDGKYVPCNISKAIHFLNQAANQDFSDAQYKLGHIFSHGKHVPIDAKKAIAYYEQAANQDHIDALFTLGYIYYNGQIVKSDYTLAYKYFIKAVGTKLQITTIPLFALQIFLEKYVPKDFIQSIHSQFYTANFTSKKKNGFYWHILGLTYFQNEIVPRDINKAVYYFTLAANQNFDKAEHVLGDIFALSRLVPQDNAKALYYYLRAAEHNNANSQYKLGIIYYNGEIVPQNITKALHYLSLAANQNHADAQYTLGLLYYSSKYIKQDLKKSIYYVSLAANQNLSEAQSFLGAIYLIGYEPHAPKDIKKAIFYLKLAANQNHKVSQYILGYYYITGFFFKQDINQGIYYLNKSSDNDFISAHFILGFLYHTGIYVEQDIKKAISYYKKSSTYNFQCAKNNLGVIYMNEIKGLIKKNIGFSIQYFNEAIEQNNDVLSMFNLALLYFYEEPVENSIEKSINLLIQSANKNFFPSKVFLSMVLIYEYGIDLENIKLELSKNKLSSIKLYNYVCTLIQILELDNISVFEEYYGLFHNTNFVYDISYSYATLDYIKSINQKQMPIKQRCNNITLDFYEGFGIDL